MARKFIRFVGNAFLFGKDVAAYKDGQGVALVAETVSGKTLSTLKVSRPEFENLLDAWTRGGALAKGDARIAQAALEHLGVLANE